MAKSYNQNRKVLPRFWSGQHDTDQKWRTSSDTAPFFCTE